MQPDYDNSILNLMISLKRGMSKSNRFESKQAEPKQTTEAENDLYPHCKYLDPHDVRAAKKVVLIVVDGLGMDFVEKQFKESFIGQSLQGSITSVFPTTTASAITTFNSGVAPNNHAVVGWNLLLKEIGQVSSVLPFKPMIGNDNYRSQGVPIEYCIKAPSLYESLNRPAFTFHPAKISDSDFSRFATRGAKRFSYRDNSLDDLIKRASQQINSHTEPGYYYLYWPYFDETCHNFGSNSDQAVDHYLALDNAINNLISELKPNQNTLLLLTADHGMIDTAPDRVINVTHYPEIQQCLSLPICGEPRVAYCYVAAQQAATFEKKVIEQWSDYCTLYRSDTFIQQGWYGRGPVNRQLYERVGDYILLMKENYVLFEPRRPNQPFYMVGVHGGVTPYETIVPICSWSI